MNAHRTAPTVCRVRTAFITTALCLGTLLILAVTSIGAQATSAGGQTSVAARVAPAGGGALRWSDSVRRVIDAAVIRGDLGAATAAVALVDRALGAFPNDGLLLHYRGYAAYRVAQLTARSTKPGDAKALYEESLEWLDRSLAVRPMAETHAIRASSMGQLMAGSMLLGVRYGAAAGKAENDAERLSPNNPRALLLRAISTWFKPAMFGGGEEKARVIMTRALAAYGTDAQSVGLPAWGHAEALAWHGQMEQKAGRTTAARAAFEKALVLEPEYGWVKQLLRTNVQ